MDANINQVKDTLSLFKVFKKVMDNIHKNMEEHFKEFNLTGPQIMLIMILFHNGKMKISDLSSKMSLSNSTVSGIVDRLEKQDFVKRIRSKDDRRVVYVEVTSKLKKVGKAKRDRIEKSVQFIISSATPEEMDVIKKGLLTLEKVIDRKNKEWMT